MGRDPQPGGRILIVEDDAAERHGVSSALRLRGHEVIEAETCDEALRFFNHSLDAVITDLRLPDGDAVQLLPRMRAIDLTVPVYVITGFASIDVAVKAVKLGAEEFFTKPVEMSTLLACVDKAIERRRTVKSGKTRRFNPEDFATSFTAASSDAMRDLETEIDRLRTSDVSVLIIGETGTGKSMLAERLHDQSVKRHNGPFIEVSCRGLKKDFVDTELFGPDSAAAGHGPSSRFSPALFDAAKGGTLYLDEIGEVDLEAQPKILKALEGEQRDFRIIASSSHQDLVSAVTNKTFLADLFYRISTVTLRVPPLRERKADLQPIVERMLAQRGAAGQTLSPEAWEKITSYAWPGNLSELRNVLERALLSRKDGSDAIQADDIRFDQSFTSGNGPGADATLEQMERDHIERALEAEKGRVKDAARRLGIPRSTLYQKIKNFGIPLPVRGARQMSGTTMKAVRDPIPRVSGEVKVKLPPELSEDEDNDDDEKAGSAQ